ncbi:MAG: hypothetical protein KGL39_09065 [Patescibacteria group bacterium]|nr:hypothetical protein [Patescibacteria group bacterium]
MSAVTREAARLLNRLDAAAVQEAARKRPRSPRTPEMRLLKEHYALLGEQDAALARELDPSKHLYNCRCKRCDRQPRACSVNGCDRVLTGDMALTMHLRWHEQAVARARRRLRSFARAGATALLEALLDDPARAATLDLTALRSFDVTLRAVGPRRKPSVHLLRASIEQYAANPNALWPLRPNVPAPAASAAAKLALLCGVSQQTVAAALVVYGLDALARSIRENRTAPPVYVRAGVAEAALAHGEAALAAAQAPVPQAAAFPVADEDDALEALG